MKFSVVIVNYNVKYYLEQCLCSLYRAIDNISAEIFVKREKNKQYKYDIS